MLDPDLSSAPVDLLVPMLVSISYQFPPPCPTAYQIDQPKVLTAAASWFLHLTEVALWAESFPPSPRQSPEHLEEVYHPYRDSFLRSAMKGMNIYRGSEPYWLRGVILCVHHNSLISAANYWQLQREPCVFLLLAIKI